MTIDSKRNSLGRGLSALLDDRPVDVADLKAPGPANTLPIELIRPNPQQPRRFVSEEELAELARSIAEKGVLQPIIVRPHPEESGAYEIVAGERRWRAAQRVPLHEMPALVRSIDDREMLELAVIENLQRQDLTAVEEAVAYQRLADDFGYTQEAIADSVSKSRSHVANIMRLLSLPEGVQELVQCGDLSAGHARALINTEDPIALAKEIIRRGLTVRQTEKLVQKAGTAQAEKASRTPAKRNEKDANTSALERDLSNLLGLGVEIHFNASGGSLVLHYHTVDQLDDILHRLSRGAHGVSTASQPTAFHAVTENPSGEYTDETSSILAIDDAPQQEGGQPGEEDAAPDIDAVLDDLLKR